SGTKFDDEFNTALTFSGFAQLGMVSSADDSNDSQFFATDSNLSYLEAVSPSGGSVIESPPAGLNFQNTIFGQLTSGFDIFNKLMLTQVKVNVATGEKSSPITPVTINSATIVADDQHAVLRVSADAGFTGSATVTVTADDNNGHSTQRSFLVNVVADALNDRA